MKKYPIMFLILTTLGAGHALGQIVIKKNKPMNHFVGAAEERKFIDTEYTKKRVHYERVAGGKHSDGTIMYVCRVYQDNGSHPGKLYKDKCYVPFNVQEKVFTTPQKYIADDYQVLLVVGPDRVKWISSSLLTAKSIEYNGILGGNVGSGGSLYVCRTHMSDGIHNGKYWPKTGLCYVGWGGKEISRKEAVDILMVP